MEKQHLTLKIFFKNQKMMTIQALEILAVLEAQVVMK
jgi:hypothetical protein